MAYLVAKPCRSCSGFVITADPMRVRCYRCEAERAHNAQVLLIAVLIAGLIVLGCYVQGGAM